MSDKEEIVFCKGGGCTAKLGPGILARVLEKIPKTRDENLMIGYDSSDDAAVYKLTDDLAVVQTLDFFPPMVDDPYTFGQIAAANALSDIYAMGGDVKTALNIVCFPENWDLNILGQIMLGGGEKVKEAGGVLAGGHSIADGDVKTALNIVCFPENWDLNILGQIMLGGGEKVKEAGGVLAGGHSIADTDVKYGLSVMGTIHPDKVFANNGCRVGDVLILTKPLGVGIVCTANRIQEASEEAMAQAIRSMTTLNKYASEVVRKYQVHGCTDVTGFGFLGHLLEMLGDAYSARAIRSMTTLNKYASEVVRKYQVHGCTDVTGFGFLGHLLEMLGDAYSARVESSQVPYIPEAFDYAGEFYLTAAAQRNRNHVGENVQFFDVPFEMEEILFDPQTSGGLLVSIEKSDAEQCLEELKALGLPCAIVGEVTEKREKKIEVR